jgi:hypothetical protein
MGGTFPRQPSSRVVDVSRDTTLVRLTGAVMESVRAGQGRLPKLQFPMFNGDESRLWRSRCENYFDMYGWSRICGFELPQYIWRVM